MFRKFLATLTLTLALCTGFVSVAEAGYALPARHITETSQDKTFALFVTTTPVGDFLVLAENVSGDWLGRYTSTPRYSNGGLEGFIQSTYGGNVNAWLVDETVKVNATLQELLTAPEDLPPPVAGNYLDAVNNILVQEWTLAPTADGKLELRRK